ncbi:hypothetical protein BGX21_005127 [Mortierella sp. AD011]|nr:hypothetical protein BGX20_006679 [Mortierella sp. AD010]KAF9371474.1 hypothetical protein BGX21_005127 [Mortierella sp. AD011]
MSTTTIAKAVLSQRPATLLSSLYTYARSHASRILVAYILYILLKYRNTALGVKPRPDLPGPKGWPLIGNTIFMINRPKSKNHQINTKFHEEYGKVYTVTVIGFPRVINITDPEMIDHILRTNFWNYEKGKFFRAALAPLIGGGIFGADGQHWRWQRKLASHIFTAQSLRDYTDEAFRHGAQLVVDYFNKITDTSSKSEDENAIVDLQNVFLLFTLDTFGEVAFGQSFGCLKDPSQQIEFAVVFDRMNTSLTRRFRLPFWKVTEWWTGRDKQIERDTEIISDFAYNLIRKRRLEVSERQQQQEQEDEGEKLEDTLDGLGIKGNNATTTSDSRGNQSKNVKSKDGKKKDLMQLFMDATDDNGEKLSDEALRDTLLNFILAGRDTTAQALSWMFYLILRSDSRKEILEKLVSEIDSTLDANQFNNYNQDTASAVPTFDTIKTQKYAEACLYESLRLYPSVPRNIKICIEDDVLPKGVRVYKDEIIGWDAWAMGRDTTIWGPDAHEYRPERWLQGEKFSPSKFIAFNLGPRTCLGQQFATMEAIMITSMILRNFSLELVHPDKEPTYEHALTLPMAEGLPVKIRRRALAN